MTYDKIVYVRYRLEKARDALQDARILFPASLHGTVSRLYYACFYAASAALMLEGKETRRHATVCRLFKDAFVKTGHVPVQTGKFLPVIFDQRLKADYGDLVTFKRDMVEGWITETERFIGIVGELVEKRLSELEKRD